MRMGILGRKVGMTQIFDENGYAVPVTVIDTKDCYITQVKTKDSDGYVALQLSYGDRKPQNVDKARGGHFKKSSVAPKATVQEIRLEDTDNIADIKAGQALSAGMFAKGDKVDVIGATKGRGFQGVYRRYRFHGTDASHGGHKYYRHGGSNGSNTFPGKVLKNKGMPGRMGGDIRTIPKLEVIDVKASENLIFLRGAVPGHRSKIVMVRSAKKAKDPGARSWTGGGKAETAEAAEAKAE